MKTKNIKIVAAVIGLTLAFQVHASGTKTVPPTPEPVLEKSDGSGTTSSSSLLDSLLDLLNF